MIQKIKNILNSKYRTKTKQEKDKLYISTQAEKYIPSRNRFRIFKTKIEFDNTISEIKKINVYYYFIGLFLIVSSAYVLVFSHYFSVKSIDIIRNDDLINVNLAYKSVEDIRYSPIILVDKNEIERKILSHQPNIKDIKINKILPSNIKIILNSYENFFYTEIEKKVYQITTNGVFIPGKAQKKLQKIDIIGIDNLGILDYKKILLQENISKIKEIVDLIKSSNSFINISKITYYKKENELHILNKDSEVIIFDLTKNSKTQIEKLNIFYKRYYKKIKSGIIYIDLRINEKVIFCDKENELDCKRNLNFIYN